MFNNFSRKNHDLIRQCGKTR